MDADGISRGTSDYKSWVTHGNGALATSVTGPEGDSEAGQEDSIDTLPGVNLDISLVASASDAIMYLSYAACPWLMREIPLDPDNPFVNGQILAGEITRSTRFARTASKGRIDGRVTVFGAADRVSFLTDFLKEQTGLPTQVWGRPGVDSDPEYGVAIGLALSSEGRAKS